MLELNMLMNDFRIIAIVSMFRAGQQDGAIVLGQRAEDKELVVAEVAQHQIDLEGPATNWIQGHYFPWGPEDTDLSSRATEEAGAYFGERTGIVAISKHVEQVHAAIDEQAAAQAALAKVLAEAQDKTYTLIYTDYSESLTPKQVDVLLRGDNEFDSSEFSRIEEAESDQSYGNAIAIIKDILDEDEWEALDADQDLVDEARFYIQDRNDTDLVESLLKSTGSLLVRYDLGVDVSTDWSSSDDDERREQAIEILQALGMNDPEEDYNTATEDDFPHTWSPSGARCTRCPEAGAGEGNGPCVAHPDFKLMPKEKLISAVSDILEESGSGRAYMFWYADAHELVTAARPFQQARFTEESPAPKATITFDNVSLLVLNKFDGSGYDARVPGTFTIPFDATNLVTDEGDDGTSWKDIAGLVSTAFKGDVTLAPVLPAPSTTTTTTTNND